MNVLLVDDDDLLRECCGSILAEEGFRVTEAASSRQALAAMEAGGAPVVPATDLNLRSGMNGLDLIAAVRRRRPSVRAVVISGGDGASGLHASDRFLAKPFRMDELVDVVEEMARGMQEGTLAQS